MDEKFEVVNSAIIIGNQRCISLKIPKIKSVLVAAPGYPETPEVNFDNSIITNGLGLGIAEGDLYYITLPVKCNIHIVTFNDRRIIIECKINSIIEIQL